MNQSCLFVRSGPKFVDSWLVCRFHTQFYNLAKAGNFMKKVMGSSPKKKRNFCDVGILPTNEMLSKGSTEGRYSGNARRTSVLNKLFMRHITDLMATGEHSSEFLGHNIEINKVQIAPDYKGINVFWVAKGTQNDEVVEKVLKKNAGFLRHELSTLRVMGIVPMIHFVKDRQYAQIVELDSKLAVADFGDDYVPTEVATRLKTKLELFTTFTPDIKKKIEELDDNSSVENDGTNREEVPSMAQDTFGLNHYDILNRIKKNMKKPEAKHQLDQTTLQNEKIVGNPIEFYSNKEQREAFKSFLEKRELLRSKVRKIDKNYLPDVAFMKEEFLERRNEYFKNMEIYDADEAELIDDDNIDK